MAEQLSLHTQIQANIGGFDTPVDIIATSAEELLQTVAVLTGQVQAQPQAQPQAQANPTQAAGPTPSGPTAANAGSPGTPQQSTPAPAQADTSAPSPTASVQTPEVTLNDVLPPARELLGRQNGEETLRQILANHGAESISTADPQRYPAIKQAIEQALAQ